MSAAFSVEVDAMPGGFVCSGSMKATLGTNDLVRQSLAGHKPRRKLFSKEQRALLKAHAPEGIELDDLAVMGPIFVLKLKLAIPELEGRRLVTEAWLYPDNTTLVELSTKCEPHEAFDVAARCARTWPPPGSSSAASSRPRPARRSRFCLPTADFEMLRMS